MSYEGYVRYLCHAGHTFLGSPYDDTPSTCPFCCQAVVWVRRVDQTNDDGYDPDLEIKTKPVQATCNMGRWHITEMATYHMPDDGERLPVTALETE